MYLIVNQRKRLLTMKFKLFPPPFTFIMIKIKKVCTQNENALQNHGLFQQDYTKLWDWKLYVSKNAWFCTAFSFCIHTFLIFIIIKVKRGGKSLNFIVSSRFLWLTIRHILLYYLYLHSSFISGCKNRSCDLCASFFFYFLAVKIKRFHPAW